ncbi:MAG TPA: hypothetical protein DCZ94_21735 [Lentisphaeria bacterium]|nr:MAG: hypothetical protein A2X48_19420 [Lentisphaerae bacterium GWF2_49_21]HBC89568.1 hypothetical protein [Lentisphaeria bacterium]
MSNKIFLPVVLTCLLISAKTQAAIIMPYVLGDNMVVQRGVDFPLWGLAEKGEEVTVEFNGQKVKTFADDKEGRWKLTLKPMEANSKPQQMVISAEKASFKIENVLVGDVWIYGIQTPFGGNVRKPEPEIIELPKEITGTKDEKPKDDGLPIKNIKVLDPLVRIFDVKRSIAKNAQDLVSGYWMNFDTENCNKFPEIAYEFASRIKTGQNVPVGIINISWNWSSTEAWLKTETLKKNPDYAQIFPYWTAAIQNFAANKTRWENDVKQWEKIKNSKPKNPPRKPEYPDGPESNRQPSVLYYGMLTQVIPFKPKGIVWCQSDKIYSKPFSKCYTQLLKDLVEDLRSDFESPDLPFILIQYPANDKRQELPAESSTSFGPYIREAQLQATDVKNMAIVSMLNLIGETWQSVAGDRLYAGAISTAYGQKPFNVGPVFKSMTIEGAKVKITFDNADAGLKAVYSENFDGNKGEFEGKTVKITETQKNVNGVLTTEKTITTDMKSTAKVVKVYLKKIEEKTPAGEILEKEVSRLIIEDPVNAAGFAMAAEKMSYKWANATIEGNTVTVWNDEIQKPFAVRYSWANNPIGNLHSMEGYPANCFRSDK